MKNTIARVRKCTQCGCYPKRIFKSDSIKIHVLGRPECAPCIVMAESKDEATKKWNAANE